MYFSRINSDLKWRIILFWEYVSVSFHLMAKNTSAFARWIDRIDPSHCCRAILVAE